MAHSIVDDVLNRRLIAAHRGARSLAPENTLAAARLALAAGAGMWEVDVRLSKDAEPVLAHDLDLRRTSDVSDRFTGRSSWHVDEFSLQELKTLDCGSWFERTDPFGQIGAGRVSKRELEKYCGERIATLHEALRFTVENDWLLNIEIKDLAERPGHEAIVEKVVSMVREAGAAERVLVSSFNYYYLARVRRLAREIRTGVLTDRFQPDPAALLSELDAFAFNPSLRAFLPWQVRRLKQKGFAVLVWVVNHQMPARAYFAMGADGIFTDFPKRFS
ncbi:MAG: glycerophosphodiester phosphodiesterase family protein [Syntrophobacteraceae bacterium]|nr:glycerophosphodiester phosphodiesterase family protein [Syntrophobacteraceae bacterium]